MMIDVQVHEIFKTDLAAPFKFAHPRELLGIREILDGTHVVTTTGSGSGAADEEFERVSAFSHRSIVLEAYRNFKEIYTSEKMKLSVSCCIQPSFSTICSLGAHDNGNVVGLNQHTADL